MKGLWLWRLDSFSSKVSLEGETVDMVAPIVTHQKASGILGSLLARLDVKALQAVEAWMGDLQDGMCGAIRTQTAVKQRG